MPRKKPEQETTPPPPLMRDLGKFAPVWYGLLAMAMLVSSWYALAQAYRIEEFPQAVDSFGYQHMAEAVREARAAGTQPAYTFDDPRARELVAALKASNVPMEKWQTFVAPQAFHYHPATDAFIIQYPPGVGLAMSLFERGKALWPLNVLQIGAIVGLGLAGLVVTVRRRQLGTAGVVALATTFALGLIGTSVSYSIDMIAALLPLSVTLAVLANGSKRTWLAVLLAGLAGACFGYGVLCRIALVFLLPGMMALLWPMARRAWMTHVVPFLAGVTLCGIVPLLMHQKRLTGSYFQSTYSQIDATAPSVANIPNNFANYFLTPESFNGNYALFVIALSAACLVALGVLTQQSRRLLISAAIVFLVPTGYFLIHKVPTFYYQLPGILAASVMLVLAALALAKKNETAPSLRRVYLNVGAYSAGVVAIGLACMPPMVVTHAAPLEERVWQVPEPLKDPQAIVYGERFTGTLWHFNRIAAFDITHTDADTALLALRHFHAKQRPQYVIYDNNNLKGILTQLVQRGVVVEDAGFKLDNRQVLKVKDVPR